MPQVDGFQLIEQVRRHRNPIVRRIPAAALTAYARSDGLPFDRTTMLARLGLVASVLSENISTSSTCRLKNATRLRLRELIRTNLDALYRVTNSLKRHRILLYRASSNVIPFASHPVKELRWWEEV